MSGQTTLIATTRSGVRPLGVRGEPLHNAAGQLRRVIRRRLGDAAADLLAEPQIHEDGSAIDWYAAWPGEVRQVADLPPPERSALLAQVDAKLADIARRLDEVNAQVATALNPGELLRRNDAMRLGLTAPRELQVVRVDESPELRLAAKRNREAFALGQESTSALNFRIVQAFYTR